MPKMPWDRKKSLSELQEESDRLDVEISIKQKEAAIARLRAHGLKPADFGSWESIFAWLRNR